MEKPVLIYLDRENKEFNRSFSNAVLLSQSPQGEVTLDFCEEYIQPRVLTKQSLSNPDQSEFNFGLDEFYVTREKKCSITMNKQVAIDLARRILQTYDEKEGV